MKSNTLIIILVLMALSLEGRPLFLEDEILKSSSPSGASAFSNDLLSLNQIPELEEKIYVVIGVFAVKRNAEKCVARAERKGYSAMFSLNPKNRLYYVSLYSTSQIEEAKKERTRIMADSLLFPGIWIFAYNEKEEETAPVAEATSMPTVLTAQNDNIIEDDDDTKVVKTATAPKAAAEQEFLKEGEYLIFPKVIFKRNNKEIQGKVEVVDAVRAKLMKSINANNLDVIKDPKNGSHLIQLSTNIFGYRKVQHELVLTQLKEEESEFISLKGDTVLVEFPLERLKTGDVAIMYNVFFRNDAAVMESSSKYELNSLLEMLKENPNYHIVIHGHTNGNKSGKIIKLKEENPDFFVITEENKRGYGSAKSLSTERATTIKKYLLENGITEERMVVKGWGGKKMIYDTNSLDAKKNVRVEIEILQE